MLTNMLIRDFCARVLQFFDGAFGCAQGVLRGCGRQTQLMFYNLVSRNDAHLAHCPMCFLQAEGMLTYDRQISWPCVLSCASHHLWQSVLVACATTSGVHLPASHVNLYPVGHPEEHGSVYGHTARFQRLTVTQRQQRRQR